MAQQKGSAHAIEWKNQRFESPDWEKRIVSSPAIAPRKRIASTGEIFGDGSMIELVSGPSETDGPSLLFWDGDRPVIAPRIEHGDFIYEALDLPPSLYRAIRLPSHCDDYGSARGLFASITDLFKHRLDLPERESGLLACFTIASWLADRLPTAPLLDDFRTRAGNGNLRIGAA
ncbi:MAG: hypothetical protein WBW53_00955 [Terriglobales bacterium]